MENIAPLEARQKANDKASKDQQQAQGTQKYQKRARQADTGGNTKEDKRQRRLPDNQLTEIASSSIQSFGSDKDNCIAEGLDDRR